MKKIIIVLMILAPAFLLKALDIEKEKTSVYLILKKIISKLNFPYEKDNKDMEFNLENNDLNIPILSIVGTFNLNNFDLISNSITEMIKTRKSEIPETLKGKISIENNEYDYELSLNSL